MSQVSRQERIQTEMALLAQLAQQSSILRIETTAHSCDRFILHFRGQGYARPTGSLAEPVLQHEHAIEVRLPLNYPLAPPDVRWLTPLFHPNVSYSGFVNWADVGLQWHENMGLNVVCERLWDMTRLAAYQLQHPVNHAAKQWITQSLHVTLPVDVRPLCEQAASTNSNVVKYRRRGETPPESFSGEILYIDDNTQPQPLPPAVNAVENGIPQSQEEIFYIE